MIYILVEGLWLRVHVGRAGRLHRSGELHSFSQQSSHTTNNPQFRISPDQHSSLGYVLLTK